MKKIYSFMVAAVALFAAVSCNKEMEQENLPAAETVVYTAYADGSEPESKAELNQTTLKSEWVAGDAITVLDGEGKWEFTAKTSGCHSDFTNTGNFGDYRKVMAVYPAEYDDHEYEVDLSAKSVTAYIPTYQKAQVGTYNDKAAVAVAYSETDNFAFKNACALLKFKVMSDNVTHVVFCGNDDEPITGNVKIVLGEEGVTSVECLDTEFGTELKKGTWIEANVYTSDDDKYFKKGETYYIAVAPQVFKNGVTAKLRINDGGEVIVKATTNEVRTKINTILDIKELSVLDWAVAGTFNDWNTTSHPMVKDGDFYVARNITGLHFTPQNDLADKSSSTGIQFLQQGTWRGGYGDTDTPGKLSTNSWSYFWNDNGKNIYIEGASADTQYDVYLNPETGKYVVVLTGSPMPEDKPAEDQEVTVDYWAVVGTMNGWAADYKVMTLDGDWHVATDVKLYASDQFKLRADENWDLNRGAAGDTDGVLIENDVETDVFNNGKNFSVSESGFYSIYINKSATKVKVVKTADLPAESIPGQPCDWALWAQSPDWRQIDMVTTSVPDLFVAMNVELDAYKSFLVKPAADWTTKFGTDEVNYIKADKWFAAVQGDGAGDITVEAAGTYDIYFDYTTKKVYLMSAGASYTSAAEQTASGKEPVVEEPEVTANILYLALDSVWKNNDERYAAYFFNSTGNVWVSMADSNGDGIYEVNIPAGYTYGDNVIFCRMKGTSTSNGWNNKWNQTADLTIPTDGKNLYTVKAWENSPNTHWSTK